MRSNGFTSESLQFWILCGCPAVAGARGFPRGRSFVPFRHFSRRNPILPDSSTIKRRLVILISGRGSNMRALAEACRAEAWPAEVAAVIASRPDAAGLEWAASQGIATAALYHKDYASREAFDAALADEIDLHRPDYVILAGFMRVLTPAFVNRYAGRLVNIHPSLLPAFPGLHTHAQALATGVRVHGCTVHFVTPVLDHGPIIAQGCVPVLAGDTPESLAGRVLAVEHRVFPAAVRWLAEGRVSLTSDHRVDVAGDPDRLFVWTPGG
jgi:phosphoribosylglycinamide formyltransferase-1